MFIMYFFIQISLQRFGWTLSLKHVFRSGSVKSILLRPFLKMLKIVEFIKILKIVDFGFLSFVVKMLKILNYWRPICYRNFPSTLTQTHKRVCVVWHGISLIWESNTARSPNIFAMSMKIDRWFRRPRARRRVSRRATLMPFRRPLTLHLNAP